MAAVGGAGFGTLRCVPAPHHWPLLLSSPLPAHTPMSPKAHSSRGYTHMSFSQQKAKKLQGGLPPSDGGFLGCLGLPFPHPLMNSYSSFKKTTSLPLEIFLPLSLLHSLGFPGIWQTYGPCLVDTWMALRCTTSRYFKTINSWSRY